VIVFHHLGIQQFYENLNYADYITDFEFFNPDELTKIFSLTETETFTSLLEPFFGNI